jgi:hypothetical protein
LLGLAVGSGQPADEAAAQLAVLAAGWPEALGLAQCVG